MLSERLFEDHPHLIAMHENDGDNSFDQEDRRHHQSQQIIIDQSLPHASDENLGGEVEIPNLSNEPENLNL